MADQKPIKLASGLWNEFVSGDTIGIINGGTGISSYTIGDLLYASATGVLSKLVSVAAGSYLRSGGVGTAPVWSTLTLPNTAAISTILYASAANIISALATGNTSALVTNSTGVPSLTSGTTANRVLRTDGTTVSFAQVAAATDISGSLPVANGGVDTSITDYSATSTITGWSSFTNKRLNIMNFGKGIVVEFFLSGTSNSTSVSFTVPNTIIGFSSLSIYREDNGVGSTTPAWAQQGTGAIVKFRKDSGAADTDWTASGTKTIRGSIIVFFA